MVVNYKNIFGITLLNSFYPLSKSLNEYLSNRMTFKQYKKGEFIVKKGDVCDRIHIIRKGLVISYYTFENKRINSWVGVDGQLGTSINSFFKGEPSLENIECLEDTFTESISFDEIQYALTHYKDMLMLQLEVLKYYLLISEVRAIMTKIPSASGRYEFYRQNYNPKIIERLPKKYLASLINMRPETLSRIILNGNSTKSNTKIDNYQLKQHLI
ncbi:Crp/Fnr family transcriptional regulator [Yeosuana sp. AK3]